MRLLFIGVGLSYWKINSNHFLFEIMNDPNKIRPPMIKNHFTMVNVQSATVLAASFAPNINKIMIIIKELIKRRVILKDLYQDSNLFVKLLISLLFKKCQISLIILTHTQELL
jgi:hypothetical protein